MSVSQRVLLVDGETVYLEGDGDISEDVLQQALAQLTASGQTLEEAAWQAEPEPQMIDVAASDAAAPASADEQQAVLAILQDEAGQQQTVQLTLDQAAALGIDCNQLVAEATATTDESAAAGAPPEPSAVPAAPSPAQDVASLASSVMLNINQPPSLVHQTVGGNKVTYTFEVVDDKPAAAAGAGAAPGPAVVGRPVRRPPEPAAPRAQKPAASQAHRTAAQVLRTTTPSAPIPRDPVTGGFLRGYRQKRGRVYNTGPNAGPSRHPISRAVSAANAAAQPSSASSLSPAAAGSEPDAEDADDLPVILTPLAAAELPEPRPGVRVLVRPLTAPPDAPDAGKAAGTGKAPGAGKAPGTGKAAYAGKAPGAGKAPDPRKTPERREAQREGEVGSSGNPIQLVQQGNTFRSLQPLSAEQLRQIAAVLQQSRLGLPGQKRHGMYDADANTKVMYRVVYPDDVVTRGGGGRGGRRRGRGRGRQGRRPRQEIDTDWSPPELSRAEKAERKRAAIRTRTGRVSKPPKHMVKDYRHIHRLDFNSPDLDDSDGGYSDWEDPDEPADETSLGDAGRPPEPAPAPAPAPRQKRAVPQSMRDRFSCGTCGKLCLGYGRLERHFTAHPDHQRPPVGWTEYLSKRRRLSGDAGGETDDFPTEAAGGSPRQLVARLAALSGGRVPSLCDNMAAALARFREHVRAALAPAAGPREARSAADTVTIDAERSVLTGLPPGVYVARSGARRAVSADESMPGSAGEAAVSPAARPLRGAVTEEAEAALPAGEEGVLPEAAEGGLAEPEDVLSVQAHSLSGVDSVLREASEDVFTPAESAFESSAVCLLAEDDVGARSSGLLSECVLGGAAAALAAMTDAVLSPPPPDLLADPAAGVFSSAADADGGRSALAAPDRSVSDVLGEFVDGLVEAGDLSLPGEPGHAPADLDAVQAQLRLPDTLPLLGAGR